MGLLDLLGLKRVEISPEETMNQIFDSPPARVVEVIEHVKKGYTEVHGLRIAEEYPRLDVDRRERLIKYLVATKTSHSNRVLIKLIDNFTEENAVLHASLVEVFHRLDSELTDYLIKLLKGKLDPRVQEGINEVIQGSGLIDKLVAEFEGASKKVKLKVLEQLVSLQNPGCYELLHSILKDETVPGKEEEKKFLQNELVQRIGEFKHRSFLNYFVPRIQTLATSVLYEVFSALKVHGEDFFQNLVLQLKEQNSTFQHKCLTIIHRLLDEASYFSLFTTFFGNANSAIAEETEVIIGKLLKKMADRFEHSTLDNAEILAERDRILEPLEKRLRDPSEERSLFMCEYIIRFGMIWSDILMRNIPPMCAKHLIFVQKLFKNLSVELRKKFFVEGVLFPDFKTGSATLSLISSPAMNYHPEVMPEIVQTHFMNMQPLLQVHLVKSMLEEGSILTPYLESLLTTVDNERKLRTLEILGEFDSAPAWKCIKDRITDPSPKVRFKILELINKSKFDENSLVIYLFNFLKDSDETLVVRSIEILATKNHQAILASFSKMLNHKHEAVKTAARQGIIQVTKRKYFISFNVLSPAMKYQVGLSLVNMQPSFLEEVCKEIGGADDPKKRVLMARILEVLADHLTSELQIFLIVAIKDPDPMVRAAVIMGLGRIGGPSITHMLLGYLTDGDDRVRANTVEAFGFIGDTEVVKDILPALSDENNRVRGNAIITLWKLGYFEVFETIGKMLRHEDKWMRASAVFAMGELKDSRFTNFLVMALKDKAEDVRRNAVMALDKLHPTQFVSLFQQMRFDQSEMVRKTIQNILDRFKKKV